MIGKIPFTQWDADLAVYLCDLYGNVTSQEPVWIGGVPNKSNFQDGYKGEEANVSGLPMTILQQLEETHVLDIENVWLTKVSAGDGFGAPPIFAAPSIPRDQFYAVVVIWTDGDSGVWVKRVYSRVQLRELSMASDSQVFLQKVRIEGGLMQQTAGILDVSIPSEMPTILGIVRYVSASEQVDLYTFDFGNPRAGFQVINSALLEGRGEIVFDDGSPLQISVGGDVALEIDDGGLIQVNSLVAIGGSYVNDQSVARLEFYAGLSRIASLNANGELGIPAFFETDADPRIAGAFWLGDNVDGWLASIGPNGLYGPAVADNLS